MKISRTSKKVLRQEGNVSLLLLEREGTASVYAVSFPPKLGVGKLTEQFLTQVEAEQCYKRYVDFFAHLRHNGVVCFECGRTVTEAEYSRGETTCCHSGVVPEDQYGKIDY